MKKSYLVVALLAVLSVLVGGCGGMVKVGGGPDGVVSGTGKDANGTVELKHCAAPIANIAIVTRQQPAILVQNGLPSDPLPAIRLIATQSGCFRIVDRDAAISNMKTERDLQLNGELSMGRILGGGQVVPADYTLIAEVLVNNDDSGGVAAGGLFGGLTPFRSVGTLLGGGVKFSEAQVLLSVVDNNTSVQEIVAAGKASGTDYGLGVGFAGFNMIGAGGWESTAQGKVVMGAMIDAFNHAVPQISDLHPPRPSQVVLQQEAPVVKKHVRKKQKAVQQ